MPRPRINSEPLQKIVEFIRDNEDSFLWDIYYQLANNELTSGTVEDRDGVLYAKMVSQHVDSLDDLLRVCKVNLEENELIDHRVKTSQTPMKVKTKIGDDKDGNPVFEDKPTKIQNFHIQARLKPKIPTGGIDRALESFVQKASKHAPKYEAPAIRTSKEKKFAEVSIYDLHVGKRAWDKEAGENYDTKIAIDRFRDAFQYLLGYSIDQGCDEIVMPLGNDMIHFDNPEGSTTSHTPQDTDGRWQHVLEKTENAIIEETDRVSDKVKIKFLYVPGNHDEIYSFFICKYLKAWYRNHKNIDVDESPTLTKYYRNGKNLIVYNHFKDMTPESLVNMMPVDRPQDFADCWYREAHGGHFHTRKVKGVRVDTFEEEHRGILYRVLPSLCETDAWHRRKGYDGNIKAAQALIYDKEGGIYDIKPYIYRG